MRTFRVFVRGENLFLMYKGAVKRFGFYTTRLIEALDENDAGGRAVASLLQEERLRVEILNDHSNPPILVAEEIEEISSNDSVDYQPPGFAFYEDELGTH